MTSGSSRAFRRWCAATIVLVLSWSLPGSGHARVSPMEIVKYQLRKPNFLIVVESAESMQGIPGENPARFNEVGADCQNGDRSCRLYGQAGRCEFSGMGAQGYQFDYVSNGTATRTETQSQTLVTSTVTVTQTATGTLTANTSAVITSTSSGASATAIATGTATAITSQSATGTMTTSPTGTETATQTGTQTVTNSQTNTQTGTQPITSSQTNTQTATQTQTAGQSGSQTATQTVTTSQTNTQSATQTQSASQTNTQSATQTQSASQTNTQSATQTQSASQTNTQTATQTQSKSQTNTQTATQTSTKSQTNTQTATQTQTASQTSTQTGTATYTTSQTSHTTGHTTANKVGTDTNIRGYWSLDENGGPYADTSGNNNDGTATGPPTVGSYQVAGKSAAFSSTAQYITVNMSQPASPFSIAAWVQVSDLNNIQRNTIVAFTPGQSDNLGGGGMRLFLDKGPGSSPKGSVVFDNNAPFVTTTTATGTATNTLRTVASGYGVQLTNAGNGFASQNWIFIVATVSAPTWTIYYWSDARAKDGTGGNCGTTGTSTSYYTSTSVSASSANFPVGSTQWCFGAGCTGSTIVNGLVGSLDEVRMWDRAVTAPEAANLCTCNYVSCPVTTATLTTTNTETLTPTVTTSGTATHTATQTYTTSKTQSGTYTNTGTSTYSQSGTYTNTGTSTVSQSGTYTNTGTSTSSQTGTYTNTGTSTHTSTGTYTNTGTSTSSQTGTYTYTGSSSSTGTGTGTKTFTELGPTGTSTSVVSQSVSATATATVTAAVPAVVSFTSATTETQTVTGTYTISATVTTTSVLYPVPDLNACSDASCSGTKSYCYLNSSVPCTSDSACTSYLPAGITAIPGDFCRLLNINDGSGRSLGDFCSTNATSMTCRVQQATTCSGDSCGGGDYCVQGTPAKMCQKTGLWCGDDGYGCNTSSGDTCVPATSRLMMVKNAVRRVVLEHAYDDTAVVKMGHMHTFQASAGGDTTKLFPYVKLATTATRTDVKFLPRSELVKGVGPDGKACFSESSGPSSTCTIDYGGGGAVTSPAVTYTLQSGNDSRYAVPTGDGKTYARQNVAWSSCGMMCWFASASTPGDGLYEGSYYTFNYTWGVPVASGAGSVSNPVYYTTYQGKSFGSPGNYWYLMDAERSEYVNENKYGAREFIGSTWSKDAEYPLPFSGASGDPTNASATCNASNGAQWDSNVVPMVNDTSFGGNSSLKPTQKALLNVARLDKASYGGLYATGNIEPVACALKDDNANDKYHSVDGYMSVVKGNDSAANTANGNTTPCWENHVLLVVDGLPRGPGDVAVGGVDCSASACMYDPDPKSATYNPNLTGCNCPAVLKARSLAKDGGINVHVIAASTDLTSRNFYAAATLNNIARAGSTSTSFINIPRYAASEDELYFWLNYEMKEALRVTVATTPASAASGSQTLAGITAGNMLFQTTVELPEWRGNLVGFGISSTTGTKTVSATTTSGQTATATATAVSYGASVAWDAASQNTFTVRPGSLPSADQQVAWKKRKVFFSDATGQVQQIKVNNDSQGSIDTGTENALLALGMGGYPAETGRIVQWMLGKIDLTDKDLKPFNPAVMGSVLNSMPIDVGPPGASTMPGGNHFWYAHANRPELVYLGADDGTLHAFYASTGQEAFAFIPADMVPIIAKLYAQGGQRYSPNDHIYGLAGSPKVKNLCVANCKVASNLTCSDEPNGAYQDGCPDWRTILIMGEGPGGNHPFALDITDPFPSGTAMLSNDSLLWHVGYKAAAGISASHLGETDSVPAFAYHQTTGQDDYRVLMASGYPYPSGSSSTTYLIDATAWAGALPSVSGPGATISGSGGCDSSTGQEFTVLADVAVARDYSKGGDQNLLAAYVADTWGTLHAYAPGYSPVLDKGGAPMSLGCQHPLHFSPAVVQLNRNNPNNENGNSVYLVQVTNSVLDPITVAYSSGKFPASKLVVSRLTSIGANPPTLDQTFGTSGLIQLSADATGANQLCGVTVTGKLGTASDCGAGGSVLPTSARPTGTPVAVLRSDGSGFQIFTTWYTPPAANWDNCVDSLTNGNSYVTLHEFLSNGTWAQIYGMQIQHQYVTGVQFVGTTLFITSGDGTAPSPPPNPDLGQSFVSVDQVLKSMAGDRFVKTAWTERIDAE